MSAAPCNRPNCSEAAMSDALKIAFIGAGDIARTHAAALHQAGGQLCAVYDLQPARAQALAALYQAAVADSLEELLDRYQPQGVYILTPPAVHAEQIRQVALRRLPIMCEKPITLDPAEARQAIDFAHAQEAPLMTGLTHRFHPLAAQAKALLESGELGDFAASWSHRLITLEPEDKSWLGQRSLSGGMALQYAMHDLDWQVWLAGLPAQVFAVESSFDPRPEHDIEQHLWALLRFRRGGSGSLGVSWAAPHNHVERGLLGSHGNLRILNQRLLIGQNRQGQRWEVNLGEDYDWFDVFVRQSRHFLECLQQGKPFAVSGEDGLRALEVSLAVQRSALIHQLIELDDL